MTESEYQELFAGIKLPPHLKNRLDKVHTEPEGAVEAKWVHRLITGYLYHPKQIALQVPAGAGRNAGSSNVTADIVVYRDKKRSQPFIVIEVKREGGFSPKDAKQAESYSRNLGSDYHCCSDWITTQHFKTARYIDQSTDVGNLPSWVEDNPENKYLSKTHILPPFKDEAHLRSVVRKCHDKIFFNQGHDPAKSFDELMKVFFLKMYDERVTPSVYKFAVLPDQSDQDVGEHIRSIFSEASKSTRYSDVFTTRFTKTGAGVSLDLDDQTIRFLVTQLQSYSLVNTTATLEGVDIKGTVFERMVGSTFRGELGAYFTPRELVEFCIRVVDPAMDGKVLDPSCGSGGFLIMVIKHVKEKIQKSQPNLNESELAVAIRDYCDTNIFGVDINERMVRVSKMNMIMHGDGHSGIYNSHGLNIGAADRLPVKENSIAYVFSNPPFAGRESDPVHLGRFETAVTDDGSQISLHKTIPFVEMIIKLLRPGGVAALVLPNGIFNSPSSTFKKLRKIIFAKTEILAVIGLPHWVFFHTGCDVQGSLLFLQKGTPRENYNVYLDWANNVGYDAKGAKTAVNDLPEILKRLKRREKSNLFSIKELIKNDRFDPLFYKPTEHAAFFERPAAVVLEDLVEPGGVIVSKSKKNKSIYRYLEVGGANTETGEVIELKEYPASELPSRAKWVVREGMLLLPNHRNSIAAGRSPVYISEDLDGIVVTSRFIPLFCKAPASYVLHLLRLGAIQEKLLTTVTGSSSTEIKWELIKNLPMPLPPNGDYDTFMADVIEIESRISKYAGLLAEHKEKLNSSFSQLLE